MYRRLFNEHLIDFGKTPASCSAITQASDVSMFFKAAKQVLKRICDTRDTNYRSILLAGNLKNAFQQLRLGITATLTNAAENRVIDSLQKIVYTIHNTINPEIIINGYRECGQNAPISLDINGQLTMEKYEKAISKCTTQLSLQQCQIMLDNFQHFVQIMRQRGQITEAEYDEKGIPSFKDYDSDKKPKDQCALHKQRACVMNADLVVSQFIDYQQIRITRAQNRAARAEEVRFAREAKAAEKRRRSLMSEAEKKAEAIQKRRATIARKILAQQENNLLTQQDNLLTINNFEPAADDASSEHSWSYSRDNSEVGNDFDIEV